MKITKVDGHLKVNQVLLLVIVFHLMVEKLKLKGCIGTPAAPNERFYFLMGGSGWTDIKLVGH